MDRHGLDDPTRLTNSAGYAVFNSQAAHLVHLPLLPVRDAAAGGGRRARQGAAPCHDMVHLQDTLLIIIHFAAVPP